MILQIDEWLSKPKIASSIVQQHAVQPYPSSADGSLGSYVSQRQGKRNNTFEFANSYLNGTAQAHDRSTRSIDAHMLYEKTQFCRDTNSEGKFYLPSSHRIEDCKSLPNCGRSKHALHISNHHGDCRLQGKFRKHNDLTKEKMRSSQLSALASGRIIQFNKFA